MADEQYGYWIMPDGEVVYVDYCGHRLVLSNAKAREIGAIKVSTFCNEYKAWFDPEVVSKAALRRLRKMVSQTQADDYVLRDTRGTRDLVGTARPDSRSREVLCRYINELILTKAVPMRNDPVEKIIAEALDAAGVMYVGDTDPRAHNLDFYLPDHDVYIECKRSYTERIVTQMARVEDIIVIQGIEAAKTFAKLISVSFAPLDAALPQAPSVDEAAEVGKAAQINQDYHEGKEPMPGGSNYQSDTTPQVFTIDIETNQLPPIAGPGGGFFLTEKFGFDLMKRDKAYQDSPIVELARRIRDGEPLETGKERRIRERKEAAAVEAARAPTVEDPKDFPEREYSEDGSYYVQRTGLLSPEDQAALDAAGGSIARMVSVAPNLTQFPKSDPDLLKRLREAAQSGDPNHFEGAIIRGPIWSPDHNTEVLKPKAEVSEATIPVEEAETCIDGKPIITEEERPKSGEPVELVRALTAYLNRSCELNRLILQKTGPTMEADRRRRVGNQHDAYILVNRLLRSTRREFMNDNRAFTDFLDRAEKERSHLKWKAHNAAIDGTEEEWDKWNARLGAYEDAIKFLTQNRPELNPLTFTTAPETFKERPASWKDLIKPLPPRPQTEGGPRVWLGAARGGKTPMMKKRQRWRDLRAEVDTIQADESLSADEKLAKIDAAYRSFDMIDATAFAIESALENTFSGAFTLFKNVTFDHFHITPDGRYIFGVDPARKEGDE